MKRVCQVPECRHVFEGNECPKCHTTIINLTGLAAFAAKPKKEKTKVVNTWKVASRMPYTLVPISNLLRIQLYTQDLLVRKIVACKGDFKKQSSPDLQEIRKDLNHMYVEIRSRR